MCERNHPENWHLKRFVPFYLAGLLMVAACGAPDEVKRVSVQTGGQTTGSGGGTGSESVSTSSSSSPGGSATGGVTSAATSSSVVSGGKTGGTTSSGGKGGTSTSSKGGTGAGGTTATSAKSSSAGASGGGATHSTVGGRTGGMTIVGGRTGGAGGAGGGATGTSTTTGPSSGLAVKVTKAISGNPGAIAFGLMIENRNSQAADLAAVTMRYWFAEESLGTTLVLNSDYVSVGYSNKGKVLAVKSVASASGTGADHYLEFSFEATLAAKGDKDTNDLFTVNVTVHNSGYSGKVDLTNDYSYNAGATGYNEKITLHSGGKVIWGTSPGDGGGGGGETPGPDADAGAAAVDVAPVF